MSDGLKSGAKQTGTSVTVLVGSGAYSFSYPIAE